MTGARCGAPAILFYINRGFFFAHQLLSTILPRSFHSPLLSSTFTYSSCVSPLHYSPIPSSFPNPSPSRAFPKRRQQRHGRGLVCACGSRLFQPARLSSHVSPIQSRLQWGSLALCSPASRTGIQRPPWYIRRAYSSRAPSRGRALRWIDAPQSW